MKIILSEDNIKELQEKGFTTISKNYRIIDLNFGKKSELGINPYSLQDWYIQNKKIENARRLFNSLVWMLHSLKDENGDIDFRAMEGISKQKLLEYRNFGKKSADLLEKVMEEKGLKLSP